MRQSCWCADPADAPILLMRRSCWCADPADAPILLMRQSCWCADPADARILLMRRSCWCADPADVPILLMRRSCWCNDAASRYITIENTHPCSQSQCGGGKRVEWYRTGFVWSFKVSQFVILIPDTRCPLKWSAAISERGLSRLIFWVNTIAATLEGAALMTWYIAK